MEDAGLDVGPLLILHLVVAIKPPPYAIHTLVPYLGDSMMVRAAELG